MFSLTDSDRVPANGTLSGTKVLDSYPFIVGVLTVVTTGVLGSITAAVLLVYKRRCFHCNFQYEHGKGEYAGTGFCLFIFIF